MPKKTDVPGRVVAAALELIAERGWRRLALADVAGQAGVGLDEVRRAFPSRTALLAGIGRMIDEAMLAEGAADAADSPRDRLFEVLMRRFDQLNLHRDAMRALFDDLRSDPLAGLCLLAGLERSMGWALEAARIPSGGLAGRVRRRVLMLLYADVLRVWRSDDSPDLARTMKALDSRLSRAEQLAATFDRGGPGGRRRAHEEPGDEEPEGDAAVHNAD